MCRPFRAGSVLHLHRVLRPAAVPVRLRVSQVHPAGDCASECLHGDTVLGFLQESVLEAEGQGTVGSRIANLIINH